MSEWWTYRPADLLMFAPETYYRLLELYNRHVWPVHLAAVAAALGITMLTLRRRPMWHGKLIAALLALAWVWSGWAFHYEQYATINWAARWFAAGFFVQSSLLVWQGIFRDRLFDEHRRAPAQWAGFAVFAVAVVIHPLIGPIAGRSWTAVELFGITPDPTAIATMGIVIVSARRLNLTLLIVPLLWCLISAVTLWTMRSPDAIVLAFMLMLIPSLLVWKHREVGHRRPGFEMMNGE